MADNHVESRPADDWAITTARHVWHIILVGAVLFIAATIAFMNS